MTRNEERLDLILPSNRLNDRKAGASFAADEISECCLPGVEAVQKHAAFWAAMQEKEKQVLNDTKRLPAPGFAESN